MGQGFGELTNIIAASEARRQAAFANDYLPFRLGENESAVVRILEQGEDVVWAQAGRIERRSKAGKPYSVYLVARDQEGDGSVPCPIREDPEIKVNVRVWLNVIWRDAPVYGKNDKGYEDRTKVVGNEDRLAVWEFGPVLATQLAGIDQNFKGLMSRDFRITARGRGFDRKYEIFPADPDGGPQPMSEADKKLAAEKIDLRARFATPKGYDDLVAELRGAPSAPGNDTADPSPSDYNPFARPKD